MFTLAFMPINRPVSASVTVTSHANPPELLEPWLELEVEAVLETWLTVPLITLSPVASLVMVAGRPTDTFGMSYSSTANETFSAAAS
ncbi:hypothetical protein SDC9_207971 [bioreactor metagenome]|uniref:Uncharacterized protein n=1 Tax=bioreactor metagenome TaxID=1076179 RepID=A0A645J977_9ZZZZ